MIIKTKIMELASGSHTAATFCFGKNIRNCEWIFFCTWKRKTNTAYLKVMFNSFVISKINL